MRYGLSVTMPLFHRPPDAESELRKKRKKRVTHKRDTLLGKISV